MDDIEQVGAIKDPAERAREIGRRLALFTEWNARLSDMRQAAVTEMRANGMSLAAIGRELGLHRNRVQQIAEGRPGGGRGGKRTIEE